MGADTQHGWLALDEPDGAQQQLGVGHPRFEVAEQPPEPFDRSELDLDEPRVDDLLA